MVNIDNLSLYFKKKKILHNISFSANRGEIVCIIGESGCGKSTLLNLIMGLFLFPFTLNFDNLTIRDKKYSKSTLKYLFSDHIGKTGYASQKVTESFDLQKPIKSHFIYDKDDHINIIKTILLKLGIHNVDDILEKYPFECSLGMLQRINICLSVYYFPDLLILDEITTGIDAVNQYNLLLLIKEILREQNITCIIATHDLRIAKLLAEKIYVMNSGTFLEYGETEKIFNNPTHSYTQQLVEAYNKLHSLST